MEREVHRKGLYYVVPASIMDSDRLEPLAKLLYALLSGYADEEGKCFPSDNHLANRLHVSLRQAQDLVKQLEDNGLIFRDTIRCPQNPFKRVRTITVYRDFKKSLPNARPCAHDTACVSDSEQMCNPDTHKRAVIESEAYIESEERSPRAQKSSKLEYGTHVRLKEGEYEDLSTKYGKEVIDSIIEDINNYCASKGEKYKDYAATIRSWLKRNAEKSGSSAPQIKDMSRQLAEAAQKRAIEKNTQGEINVGYNYIEFIAGRFCERIGFEEHGFRERVINQLRKWGIDVNGL